MPWRIVDRLKAPAPDPARFGWLSGHTFAHRGLHGGSRVENSLAAFAAAADAGLGIECDVRKSADGRAIVFHDDRFDRLTERSGRVDQLDVAAIAATPLRGTTQCIPALRDVLACVEGRVPLLLELKTDARRSVAALCLAVRRELEGYRGCHAVMSFDAQVGQWFARVAPEVVRGLIVTEENARTLPSALRRHSQLWQARPDFLAYDVRDLPSGFAMAQRRRGLPVLAWTVNSATLRQRAGLHADAAIAEGEGLA